VKYYDNDNEEDLAAGILFLRENPSVRERQIANALKYVQANRWEIEKNRYLGIVDSLTTRNPSLRKPVEKYC
jgi:hypothetical protein